MPHERRASAPKSPAEASSYTGAESSYTTDAGETIRASGVYTLGTKSYAATASRALGGGEMRGGILFTSLEIDEGLFMKAWALSGIKTKKGLIEEALKMYVQLHEQAGVRSLRGKLVWQGDLDAIRGERGAGSR